MAHRDMFARRMSAMGEILKDGTVDATAAMNIRGSRDKGSERGLIAFLCPGVSHCDIHTTGLQKFQQLEGQPHLEPCSAIARIEPQHLDDLC